METIESFKSIYQAYLESNLTVRDFCKKLEIPEGLFNYWQKRIRDEDASKTLRKSSMTLLSL